jgi:hypothetical protein
MICQAHHAVLSARTLHDTCTVLLRCSLSSDDDACHEKQQCISVWPSRCHGGDCRGCTSLSKSDGYICETLAILCDCRPPRVHTTLNTMNAAVLAQHGRSPCASPRLKNSGPRRMMDTRQTSCFRTARIQPNRMTRIIPASLRKLFVQAFFNHCHNGKDRRSDIWHRCHDTWCRAKNVGLSQHTNMHTSACIHAHAIVIHPSDEPAT